MTVVNVGEPSRRFAIGKIMESVVNTKTYIYNVTCTRVGFLARFCEKGNKNSASIKHENFK